MKEQSLKVLNYQNDITEEEAKEIFEDLQASSQIDYDKNESGLFYEP